MNETKRKIGVAIATGALLLNAFAPLAFADTTIQISGNGSDSNNTANVSLNQSTTVVQSNTANVSNNVSANADTGGNTAKDNTGGDVTIETGDADVDVSVNNTLNRNSADVQCCQTGDTTVNISGNGSGSNNTANLTSNSTTGVFQSNSADVYNYVKANADTGDNEAKDNTGGDVSIETGDASVNVDVSTTANANSAKVGGGSSGGSLSLWIVGNGSDSKNKILLSLDNSTLLVQANQANVDNSVYANADTGGNTAKDNTGGDVTIETGDADTDVSIDNSVNFNWADLDCGCLLDDVLAKIAGNGEDSKNTIQAKLGGEQLAFQGNCSDTPDGAIGSLGEGNKEDCSLNNGVNANADTGDNTAKDNTGGVNGADPSIQTGDADAGSDISNSGNVNILGNAALDFPDFDFNVNFSLTLSQLLALLGLLG